MTHEKRSVPCYLRTQRRAWGLTQKEVAQLLNYRSASHVSRIEQSKRAPTVEAAFACQVIFGIPPGEMFPHTYTLVEDRVMRNVYRFHERLRNTTSPQEMRKRELLSQALQRAITRPNLLKDHEA